MADEIHRDLVRFLLRDFNREGMTGTEAVYVTENLRKALSLMEDICTALRDGWSINKWYESDYDERRARWIEARGLCFRILSLLDNIPEFIPQAKNKQKYVDISARLEELAVKIYNLMVSDDKEKKAKSKQTEGDD